MEKVIEFHFYLSLLYLIEKMFVHVIKKKKKTHIKRGNYQGGDTGSRPGAGTGAAHHLPGKARLADGLRPVPGMLGEELAPAPELLHKLGLLGSLEAQLDNTGATADCKAPRGSRAQAVPWPRLA